MAITHLCDFLRGAAGQDRRKNQSLHTATAKHSCLSNNRAKAVPQSSFALLRL
jgi:hypothetical protein